MSDRVLRAVVGALRERDAIDNRLVERVTVGDAALLVELVDNGANNGDARPRTAGLAHRPPGDRPAGITERSGPTELLRPLLGPEDTEHTLLDRAIAIATLNALSVPYIDWRVGDPMADLDPDVSTIVTVGLFEPAFRKFADVEVRVIERETVDAAGVTAPDGVTVESFSPAAADAAMEDAEIVFVTGSALVYGGVEQYLSVAPADATVVLIGATASMLPEPLFDAGVDVVAGAVVEDVGQVRSAVSAGACGTDLHDRGVRKGFVSRTRTPELTPTHRDSNDCT